jgi:hypothetical protein
MKYAIPALFLGHLIIAVPITLQGATGAILRVPFPIQSRSSFGHHLSKFAIISRVVLALFWFGVQTYTGGQVGSQQTLVAPTDTDRLLSCLPHSASTRSSSPGRRLSATSATPCPSRLASRAAACSASSSSGSSSSLSSCSTHHASGGSSLPSRCSSRPAFSRSSSGRSLAAARAKSSTDRRPYPAQSLVGPSCPA